MMSNTTLPPEWAQFKRTIDFVGETAFQRLHGTYGIIFGLGGVGSHAATMLIRSGIGRLKLVDFDLVTASSLNRSAFATPAQIGQPKSEALKAHLEAISPHAQIEAEQTFFHTDSAAACFAERPAFVVDAIDSVAPKCALLRYCVENQLYVVSSMGASGRTDPTLLRIGYIHQTSRCPLARVVRKYLARNHIHQNIPAIYSLEPPQNPLPPDADEETLCRGRIRRRLPSLGTIPGIVGYMLTTVILEHLLHEDKST